MQLSFLSSPTLSQARCLRTEKWSHLSVQVWLVEKVDAIWSRVLSPNYISILTSGGGSQHDVEEVIGRLLSMVIRSSWLCSLPIIVTFIAVLMALFCKQKWFLFIFNQGNKAYSITKTESINLNLESELSLLYHSFFPDVFFGDCPI